MGNRREQPLRLPVVRPLSGLGVGCSRSARAHGVAERLRASGYCLKRGRGCSRSTTVRDVLHHIGLEGSDSLAAQGQFPLATPRIRSVAMTQSAACLSRPSGRRCSDFKRTIPRRIDQQRRSLTGGPSTRHCRTYTSVADPCRPRSNLWLSRPALGGRRNLNAILTWTAESGIVFGGSNMTALLVARRDGRSRSLSVRSKHVSRIMRQLQASGRRLH